jgi:DGQHR domain-containing protein
MAFCISKFNDRAQLFLNLGFTLVDANSVITNSTNQIIGEIDLLFIFKDYLFIVEVSKDKHSGNSKKITFYNKWEHRDNLALVNDRYLLRPRRAIRVYFDLSTNRPEHPSPELVRMTQEGRSNKVGYHDDYGYFLNCHSKIGGWALNDILDWLEYSDDKELKEIDAIQYYIGETPLFCFVQRVFDLLRTCYVSRRRTSDPGYQRTLKERRVGEISNSIRRGEGLFFPNSILISVDTPMTSQLAPPEECPKVVKINFPQGYCRCRIIDGQHRLLGFSRLSEELQNQYSLPVVALQNYDRAEEIKTFVDINSKQQKIDSNLILLLKADLEWEQNRREFKQKIGVGVARELDKSFLKDRIYFGTADEKRAEKITLSTLVNAMVNNNLIKSNVPETYSKLREILAQMQQHMPDHAFKARSYFGQNLGITVLFRLINLLQRNLQAQTIHISKEIFIKDLSRIFDSKLIDTLNNYYGEGGVNAAASYLVDELKAKYSGRYSAMETNLRQLRRKS